MAEPCKKKICINRDIFHSFARDEERIACLKYWIKELSREKGNALAACTIKYCNAALDDASFSFPNAVCLTDIYQKTVFSFASIFLKGLKLIKTYIEEKTAPTEKYERLALSNLLTFIMEENSHKSHLENIHVSDLSETDVPVQFAHHLFAPLAISPSFLMDRDKGTYMQCHCGCAENVNGEIGDTSIGNPNCWHGNLDILMNDCNLFVETGHDEEDTFLYGLMDNLQQTDVLSQVVAQTIVFSFLQKKRHPEYDHYLIPSIAVSKKEIMFHFYDSEKDILLRSPVFPLFIAGELSMRAVLSIWFVLNYKFLCSGTTDEMEKVPQSNFKAHAASHINLYENHLQLGNVTTPLSIQCYNPLDFRSRFVLPDFPRINIKDESVLKD